MAVFYIKENDTSPEYQTTLQDASGTAVDVTGATIRFHMYTQDKTTAKIDAAATIVTAASGIVKYTWQAGETDTSGWYWGEFEVTYSDSSIETFPNDGYLSIKILPELA